MKGVIQHAEFSTREKDGMVVQEEQIAPHVTTETENVMRLQFELFSHWEIV